MFRNVIISVLAVLLPAFYASAQCQPEAIGSLGGSALDVEVVGTTAYVANNKGGLLIADVSDPANPTYLGSVDDLDIRDQARHVAVSGTMVYLSGTISGSGDDGWFNVIDASDPTNPVIVGSITMSNGASGVDVEGDIAYVANGTADLRIIDVSDPTNPVIIATANMPSSAGDVVVLDSIAYVTDGAGDWLVLFDVSNPTNPIMISSVLTMDRPNGIAVSGSYACVTNDSSLEVFDISDSANPISLGSVDMPDNRPDKVDISGTTAYVADIDFGLQIVDISTPSDPVIIGSIITPDRAFGVSVLGTVAYVADIDSGLQLVDVSDPSSPSILGSVNSPSSSTFVVISGSYAYILDSFPRIQVIDISDPTDPFLFSEPSGDDNANEIVISGSLAYVTDGGRQEMRVIDISDPTNFITLGSVGIPSLTSVAISGLFAYVTDQNSKLHVIDVQEPTNPVIAGTFNSHTSWLNHVTISENIAYVAGNSGFYVIDVSDQANPSLLSFVETTGAAVHVATSGSVAYVVDFIRDEDTGNLIIFDISDPANPIILGSTEIQDRPRSVAVSGTLVCVAASAIGLVFVDVSDPTNPVVVNEFRNTDARKVVISGSLAYVAATSFGFQVIDISSCQPPGVELNSFEIITGTLLSGDINDLSDSDDSYVHTRSGFGATFIDLHNMEMSINATTTMQTPSLLDLTIESHIDEPSGFAQVRMMNFNTNDLDIVGSYPIGSADAVELITDIDASDYISNQGDIEMSIKHMVFVPFFAFTFESFIDQVEIAVR